jgi:hypothetical protein
LVREVKDYAIYRIDTEGRVLSWNIGAQLLKGYKPQEIKGRHFSIFYTAEDQAAGKPQYELEIAARDGRFEDESWRVRSDGSRVWANEIITALHDDSGKLCGYTKISRDLSERKEMEDALRESEARHRLLVENAIDYAIFMMDVDGRIRTWNVGAQRIFRYSDEEAIGQAGSLLFTPEDVARGQDGRELATAASEGRAMDDRWQLRKGGERFWASGVTTAVRDPEGILRGFAKICRDLTTSKRHEQEREHLLEQEKAARLEAERAMTLRDEFLAVVSHELRTPLTAIILWAGLLRPMLGDEEEKLQAIEIIERSASAQQKLVDDLLDMSRLISGKVRLHLRETELTPLIKAAVSAVEPMASAKNIGVDLSLDENAGIVLADPDRIQQVIWNLVHNAVKFTPRGGRVGVRLERLEALCRIRVIDTGIGISPEFVPYAFERFRQADSSTTRPYGGLGLGLAICRQLVELHGGVISAESAGIDQGSVFTVELPLASVQQRSPAAPANAPGQWPMLGGVRALVVEDDSNTRGALRRILQKSQVEVVAVESAREALEAYRASHGQRKFDVLISDVGLPDQDGYALIQQVRELERQQTGSERIPAVALTAYATDADSEKSLAAGFQSYMSKPFEVAHLLHLVADLTRNNDRRLRP